MSTPHEIGNFSSLSSCYGYARLTYCNRHDVVSYSYVMKKSEQPGSELRSLHARIQFALLTTKYFLFSFFVEAIPIIRMNKRWNFKNEFMCKNKCVWFSFQICHSLFTQKSLYLIWLLWWYYTAPYYPLSTITGLGLPKKNSLSEASPPSPWGLFFSLLSTPLLFFNTSGNDCDITICV